MKMLQIGRNVHKMRILFYSNPQHILLIPQTSIWNKNLDNYKFWIKKILNDDRSIQKYNLQSALWPAEHKYKNQSSFGASPAPQKQYEPGKISSRKDQCANSIRQNQINFILSPVMRGKFERFKKSIESHYDEGQNKIYQVLHYIQNLHQLRIVEFIARPIPYQEKQLRFQTFKQKFVHLHFLLQDLRKQLPKESESGKHKAKGNNSTVGVRQRVKRQDIRKIESFYRQVLIEGSFKYYYMVAKLQGLPLTLQAINIEDWAMDCLEQQKQTCC